MHSSAEGSWQRRIRATSSTGSSPWSRPSASMASAVSSRVRDSSVVGALEGRHLGRRRSDWCAPCSRAPVWSAKAPAVADDSTSQSRPAVSAKNWFVPLARAGEQARARGPPRGSRPPWSSAARRRWAPRPGCRWSAPSCSRCRCRASSGPRSAGRPPPAKASSLVPSGTVRSKSTLFTASTTYQSML